MLAGTAGRRPRLARDKLKQSIDARIVSAVTPAKVVVRRWPEQLARELDRCVRQERERDHVRPEVVPTVMRLAQRHCVPRVVPLAALRGDVLLIDDMMKMEWPAARSIRASAPLADVQLGRAPLAIAAMRSLRRRTRPLPLRRKRATTRLGTRLRPEAADRPIKELDAAPRTVERYGKPRRFPALGRRRAIRLPSPAAPERRPPRERPTALHDAPAVS
jgi:hypothetical protein